MKLVTAAWRSPHRLCGSQACSKRPPDRWDRCAPAKQEGQKGKTHKSVFFFSMTRCEENGNGRATRAFAAGSLQTARRPHCLEVSCQVRWRAVFHRAATSRMDPACKGQKLSPAAAATHRSASSFFFVPSGAAVEGEKQGKVLQLQLLPNGANKRMNSNRPGLRKDHEDEQNYKKISNPRDEFLKRAAIGRGGPRLQRKSASKATEFPASVRV